MKIRSLILGSVAAAGLATGAQAADLAKGVMTSLDVCDALGLSGLTISSDTNCLQITGGVSYMFAWGDFKAGPGSNASGQGVVQTPDDNTTIPIAGDSAGSAGTAGGTKTDWDTQMIAWLQVVGTQDSDFGPAKVVIKLKSEEYRHTYNGYGYYDGDDTGGSTTNVGSTTATTIVSNTGTVPVSVTSTGVVSGSTITVAGTVTGSSVTSTQTGSTTYGTGEVEANGVNQNGVTGTVLFDQAYVSVGDSTVLTAGKTGSIVNTDDDTPLNYLGLFNSDNVGTGVLWSVSTRAGGSFAGSSHYGPNGYGDSSGADIQTGGHSIQIVSSLGNGLTLKGGLEDLQDQTPGRAGTAIGVISYAGDNLTAHLSLLEGGILDGHPDVTAYHAGFTGTFDKFKLVGAIAGDSSGYYDALGSAQISLDLFKLAASFEATQNASIAQGGNGDKGLGYGASASFAVSDAVTVNVGGRYFDTDTATPDNEAYELAASLQAAVTETLTLEGDVGLYAQNSGGNPSAISQYAAYGTPGTWQNTYFGAASVSWAPGGGFTSSLKGEIYSNGAYKATFNAAKNFQ